MTEPDPIYKIITDRLIENSTLLQEKDFEINVWRLLKRSSKDHDHFVVDDLCFILILSDDRDIIEILIDDECSDDDFSVQLDSDDDWRSDLDDYNSEEDEDYVAN